MSSGNDDADIGAPPKDCESCGSALEEGQRYCLRCGARSGAIPAAFAEWLSVSKASAAVSPDDQLAAVESSAGDAAGVAEDEEHEDASLAERYMPEPRSAAVATMALLAFGVVVGAATGPIAQSAGVSPIVVEMGSSAPPTPPPEEEVEETEVEVEEGAGTEGEGEAPEAEGEPEGGPENTTHKSKERFEEPPPPPPIQHVFLISLGEHGFEEGFGSESPAPYLAQELVSKGELLANYYAVTQGRLANEIALLSGQGPTVATAEGCPEYADIASPVVGAEEQVEGAGCVYPAETKTLPSQLAEAKKSWKSYVEDGGGCAGGESRNPLVFFHSILDKPECSERSVGLDQLATDLKEEKSTPSLSYIVPNSCHDGGEQPCQDGHPGGLAEAQPFLEEVVPEIQESQAYKAGGLIAITFAQAPQGADQSACCGAPEYPNLPPSAPVPISGDGLKSTGGGGRVGLLLLSPFVEPGTVNESADFDHFSLLLSIEEAFGLQPLGYAASPTLTPFASAGVYNLAS